MNTDGYIYDMRAKYIQQLRELDKEIDYCRRQVNYHKERSEGIERSIDENEKKLKLISSSPEQLHDAILTLEIKLLHAEINVKNIHKVLRRKTNPAYRIDIDTDMVKELYDQGYTAKEIAKLYECHLDTVSNRLNE